MTTVKRHKRFSTSTFVGGYTAFTTEISKEAFEVFRKAVDKLTGVKYTPLAVSSQVVAGTNYRFFCDALGVYPDARHEAVMMDIFQPLEGAPHILQIRKLT